MSPCPHLLEIIKKEKPNYGSLCMVDDVAETAARMFPRHFAIREAQIVIMGQDSCLCSSRAVAQ